MALMEVEIWEHLYSIYLFCLLGYDIIISTKWIYSDCLSFYIAVTNFSGLLQGKSPNHDGDFYCLNCFNSYTTKNKLKKHEEVCNNHDSCYIEMLKCIEKILKYRKIIKGSICNLSWFGMFTKKRPISWK